MKILTNKIIVIFIVIAIIACGNTIHKNNKGMITNLLDKQLQIGISWENDVTDVPNGYIYTKEDLDISSDLIYGILSKRGFKSDSLSFRHRIKDLFGISIDTFPMQIKIDLDGTNYDLSTDIKIEMFQKELTPTIIFSPKNNIILFPYYIPELIDYKNMYPDVARIEESMSTKRNGEFGEITVSKWSDHEKELNNQRQYNIANLFHVNNYLIHNHEASLTWLAVNNSRFLSQLLVVFGYDEEDKINKLVLDEIPKNENGWYSGESFNGVFATQNINNKLKVREGLLKYMRKKPNNSYARMLNEYGDYCLKSTVNSDFTKSERFKIAAYMAYYLRLIYLDNSSKDSSTDEYIIINDMLFREIGDLVNEEGNPSEVGEDSEFLSMIIKNNYYNLPNFKEMIDNILNDCR